MNIELEERIKIYKELEDGLIKFGKEIGKRDEKIDWIISLNHLLEQAEKFDWDNKGSTYTGALKDLKKRMKATGIENLFVNK